MSGFSTRQAAQKLGVSFPTLNKYIGLKLIPMPPVTYVGGVRVRLWSDADIEKVRQVLPKIQNGRKTRHQKQVKSKQKKRKSKP